MLTIAVPQSTATSARTIRRQRSGITISYFSEDIVELALVFLQTPSDSRQVRRIFIE
jgi:hypothetical protein